MQTKSIILAAIAAPLFFLSCNKEQGDTQEPTIKLSTPAEGDTLYAGHAIHIDMELFDNDALASYNINIHNNFDGHEHEHDHDHKSISLRTEDEDHDHEEATPFSFNKSWDNIVGEQQAHVAHDEIIITEEAAEGKYHLVIHCLDKSGNETPLYRNIVIAHHDHHEH